MHEAFEMDLTLEEVAAIFALKGWLHGTERRAGIPDAETLYAHVAGMVKDLERAEVATAKLLFNSSGRFTVHTDPEMPDSYEIHLYIGNVDKQKLKGEMVG